MSAADALYKFSARAAKIKKRRGPNKKPEFEFKKEIMAWLKGAGFLVNKIESKAVYSEAAGRYISGQTDPGFSDLIAVAPQMGIACFIELKAPGRRSTLKEHQRIFLAERIERLAFACVTDSIEHFSDLYRRWSALRNHGQIAESARLLLNDLPTK